MASVRGSEESQSLLFTCGETAALISPQEGNCKTSGVFKTKGTKY